MVRIILASALVGLFLTACGEDESDEEPIGPVASSEGASLDDWVGEGEGAPDPHAPGANPAAAGEAPGVAPEGQPDNVRAVQGTVRERLDAAGYTYLRVETEAGDVWIAAMGSQHEAGAQVTAVGTLMQDFRSNALDRTFPELLLAGRVMDGIVQPGEAPPPAAGAAAPSHPPVGATTGDPHGGPPAGGNPHGGPPAGGNPHGGPPAGGNPHGGPPAGSPHGGPPGGGMPAGHP